MRLDLSAVLQNEDSALSFDYEMDMSGVKIQDTDAFDRPVKVIGEVKNIAGSVVLKGNASTNALSCCERCLKPVRVDINSDFEYYISTDRCDEEKDTVIVLDDVYLDIDSIAYDSVLLEFMQKHLCDENCKGLCSVCGCDLNETQCDCSKKQTDPRLSILSQLLD